MLLADIQLIVPAVNCSMQRAGCTAGNLAYLHDVGPQLRACACSLQLLLQCLGCCRTIWWWHSMQESQLIDGPAAEGDSRTMDLILLTTLIILYKAAAG